MDDHNTVAYAIIAFLVLGILGLAFGYARGTTDGLGFPGKRDDRGDDWDRAEDDGRRER